MSIASELNDRMKQAMKARDRRLLDVIRMVKTKVTEATTAPGFKGEADDALWLSVIESYAKSQQKALDQYRDLGEAGAAHAVQIEYELGVLSEWLPEKVDEATMAAWVDEAIAGLGGKERAKFGQVMGVVMKAHKADVDPNVVRDLVKARLAD